MRPGFELTKVLITVMTYPYPSRKYRETVCTAGITESGRWVRLYPVDYRYRPSHQKFHKYQWIDVALSSESHGNDVRRESRKPDLESIQLVGKPLSTKDKWNQRRQIIDAMPHHTVNELRQLYEKIYQPSVRKVTLPVLVIYLTDSPQNCLERIHRRNRPYEQKIEQSFLEILDADYQQLLKHWKTCPVIRKQTSELDYTDDASIDHLANQIKCYTAGHSVIASRVK